MGVRGAMTRLEFIALVFLLLAVGWGATVILRNVGSSSDIRNQRRSADIRLLENALVLYALEHDGRYPEGIGEEPRFVCQQGVSSCEGTLDLQVLVPRYLEHIPTDPFAVGVRETFYTVHHKGRRLIIAAPYAEGKESMRVER